MNRRGRTASARRWLQGVTVAVIVIATGARAVSPDPSHLMPASPRPGVTTGSAVFATASAPAAGNEQAGLYENESIRRTPIGGAPVGGGAGTAAPVTSTPWSLSRVPAALAAVLVLIVGLRWMMGKMSCTAGRNGSTRAMRVLARSAVAPRQQLLLIQIGKRLVLVGNSGGAMNPLCEINDPSEVASLVSQVRAEQSATPVSSFKSMFGRANNDYEAAPPPPMFKTRNRDKDAAEREEESAERSAAADLLERRETRDEVMLSAEPAVPPGTEEDPAKPETDDAEVQATRGELTELMAKVRRLAQGFQR